MPRKRKRAPGAGRPPAGPISGKLSNFSTRITQETRAALEGVALKSGQSISQVAERMIELGLTTAAERERANPTQALTFLIAQLAEDCAVYFGNTAFRWNTDAFVFDALAYTVQLMLGRLRPLDSALSQHLREDKDVDELAREMFASPENWAKHVFFAVWDDLLSDEVTPELQLSLLKEIASDRQPHPGVSKMFRREYGLQKVRRDLNIKIPPSHQSEGEEK
jgi:hypothetical protein